MTCVSYQRITNEGHSCDKTFPDQRVSSHYGVCLLKHKKNQGNSVARDLPPTGSEANTQNFFIYNPPPPPQKILFLKMLEIA